MQSDSSKFFENMEFKQRDVCIDWLKSDLFVVEFFSEPFNIHFVQMSVIIYETIRGFYSNNATNAHSADTSYLFHFPKYTVTKESNFNNLNSSTCFYTYLYPVWPSLIQRKSYSIIFCKIFSFLNHYCKLRLHQ